MRTLASGAQLQTLYRPLRPGPHGRERDHEQVLAHQRMRLHEAMVEAVSQLGYDSVTVVALVRLAAVSKRALYENFSSKQECFLATLDAVIADATTSVVAAGGSSSDGRESLRRLFAAGALYVETHPKRICVCVVTAPAAGPDARARIESFRVASQSALARAVRHAFGAQAPPPLASRGVAHGIWHLLRSRLLDGEVEQLSLLADELYGWLDSYRCRPGALAPAPEIAPGRPVAALCKPVSGDVRRRLHRAALELAGRRGLAELGERPLLELARVEKAELEALYEDPHACFLDALGLLAADALRRMLAAGRSAAGGSWPAVVRASVAALLDWLAREPALARAAFVEAFRGGPDIQRRMRYLLAGLATLLRRSAPEPHRPSEVVADGIVAAIWGVLHDYVAGGSIDQMPELTDHISFIVLAPTIGAESAIEALRQHGAAAAGTTETVARTSRV